MKNFSRSWICGSTNQRSSNIIDHAKSEQHKVAMTRLRTEQARLSNVPIVSYAPIVQSFAAMETSTREKLEKRFDVCYMLAKEDMAFRKYPAICHLERKHGVELGESYQTKDSASAFTGYIALQQRNTFLSSFSKAHFFSFLMDGSTDAGNIEEEIFVLLHCLKDDSAEVIRCNARFFSVVAPKKADADGLIECLSTVLQEIGICSEIKKSNLLEVVGKPILVGGGTDGASVNVGEQNGMKGKLRSEIPWLFWAWCYGHCLELACKDALLSNIFKNISEMLLKLFSIYSKSPKKSRELLEIASDLKEIFSTPKGGDLPIRSQGTRWITHKRRAMQRVVDRFGVYIHHLNTLSKDRSINSRDRARIVGYLRKWQHSDMLIGCALYVDILKSPSCLSLSLQQDNLDIISALQNILKSVNHLKKLSENSPDQWPTVKLVLSKIVNNDDGSSTYQGARLQPYNKSTLESCQSQAVTDLLQLDQKLRHRLEWFDVKLLRSILVFVDTQGWACRSSCSVVDVDANDELEPLPPDTTLESILEAADYIFTWFREPLEKLGVGLLVLQEELEDVVLYSRNYMNLHKESYSKVWYKIHTSPDAKKWPNVLLLCELVFALPFSNGVVERIFSNVKIIKSEKRTSLSVETLRDLLEIKVEGPPFDEFVARPAVELWWRDCRTTRRVNQQLPRKEYQPREGHSSTAPEPETDSEDATFSLNEWDIWFSEGMVDTTQESSESPCNDDDIEMIVVT